MSDAMRVVEFTAERCVIYNPAPMLGYYFGGVMLVLNVGLKIACHYSEALSKKVDNGWLGFFIMIFLIPAWLSGHTDKVTLDRQAKTLTVQTRSFFVFFNNKRMNLDDVTDATVTGKYSQLQINLQGGGFVWVGPDTYLGGRDLAANAITNWMQAYRTGAPLQPTDADSADKPVQTQ